MAVPDRPALRDVPGIERYTERAKRALCCAVSNALESHSTVGAEHLLLALLEEASGLSRQLFVDHGVAELLARPIMGPGAGSTAQPSESVGTPFAPDTRAVLGLATLEADQLSHPYVGTEHLLLGLLRHGESSASALLNEHGMTIDEVLLQVRARSRVRVLSSGL